MADVDRATLHDRLLGYVRDDLKAGTEAEPLTVDSPLLDMGVLDSVRTARLLAHIRSEYGVRVPPGQMTGEHFRSVAAIADLVLTLRSQAASL
ncbi:acyl carrier protein [Streptomyces montanisoli]|uniref:Acyl carrier protein n=1 Tax=Streptomyces montanisoli TaxID=2798581 RepID=A0A940MB41_9ACTN|nr:acyl carrier protein [Streptomyces montanisoli]MBP0456402.1 acyl carrier protein [Streptomyces montanisoli]